MRRWLKKICFSRSCFSFTRLEVILWHTYINVWFYHVSPVINQGFIFSADGSEKNSLLTWKYDDKCSSNETIRARVNEFKTKYHKIKRLSGGEIRFVRRQGFRTVFAEVCAAKRDMVRTMTDWIQPVADFCVTDQRARRDFVLNTLLLVETTLDFFCGMNQSQYVDIYERRSLRCFDHNTPQLGACQKNSFDLYFWEKLPDKAPTLLQLLNGSVCK